MTIDPVSLGITIALSAASAALTMSRTIEGARLSDLDATVADYGTPMNYVMGIDAVYGACFYMEPIEERKKKRKTKGGKYKDYTYYGRFAIVICDHEVQGYRRIWLDSHLAYDAVNGESVLRVGGVPTGKSGRLTEGYELEHFVRFYYGTATQDPDPRMQAYLEQKEGLGTCPAFRFVSYIFFDRLPLEKFGNRLPQVRAEVTGLGGGGEFVAGDTDDESSGPLAGGQTSPISSGLAASYGMFKFSPNQLYGIGGPSDISGGYGLLTWTNTVGAYNIANLDYSATIMPGQGAVRENDQVCIDDDGNVYLEQGHFRQMASQAPGRGTYKIPNFGLGTPVQLGSYNDIPIASFLSHPFTFNGTLYLHYRHRTVLGHHILYVRSTATGAVTTKDSASAPWSFPVSDIGIAADSYGDVWAIGMDQDTYDGNYGASGEGPIFNRLIMWKMMDGGARPGTGNVVQITGLPNMDWDNGLFSDARTNNFAHIEGHYVVNMVKGRYDFIDDTTFQYVRSILFEPGEPYMSNGSYAAMFNFDLKDTFDLANRRIYFYTRDEITNPSFFRPDVVHIFDLDSGEALGSIPVDDWDVSHITLEAGGSVFFTGPAFPDNLFYSPAADRLVGMDITQMASDPSANYDFPEHLVFMEINGGALTLADVAREISIRVGLSEDDDDFDVSDIDDVLVTGCHWPQGQGKAILGPWLDLYDVHARMHGFTLEFIHRGKASKGLITSNYLVRKSDGPRYKAWLTSESDIPRRLFVAFTDSGGDMNPNTAVDQRNLQTSGSVRELTLDLKNLVLDVDEAARFTARLLRRYWFERLNCESSVSLVHELIEAGDIWDFELDGEQYAFCVNRLLLGADGVIDLEMKRDSAAVTVVSDKAGAVALGQPPTEIEIPGPTEGFILDIPQPYDSLEQTAPYLLLAAGPEEQDDTAWMGADFAISTSGNDDEYTSGWDAISASQAATWGLVVGALPDDVDPYIVDWGSEIFIQIQNGEPTSVTEEEALAERTVNLWLIGDEIVQIIDFSLIYEDYYRCTGFIRAIQGTEWAMGLHEDGERALQLDQLNRHSFGASEIGLTRWYWPSSVPFLLAEAEDETELTFTAAAHRPLSPVHPEVEFDSVSGSWNISWTRRTRIGGQSIEGQDVPLGESYEEYKLIIVIDSGEERTEIVTEPEFEYTSAMQVADTGGPVAFVFGTVQQRSPSLNLDGYPLEFTSA